MVEACLTPYNGLHPAEFDHFVGTLPNGRGLLENPPRDLTLFASSSGKAKAKSHKRQLASAAVPQKNTATRTSYGVGLEMSGGDDVDQQNTGWLSDPGFGYDRWQQATRFSTRRRHTARKELSEGSQEPSMTDEAFDALQRPIDVQALKDAVSELTGGATAPLVFIDKLPVLSKEQLSADARSQIEHVEKRCRALEHLPFD